MRCFHRAGRNLSPWPYLPVFQRSWSIGADSSKSGYVTFPPVHTRVEINGHMMARQYLSVRSIRHYCGDIVYRHNQTVSAQQS